MPPTSATGEARCPAAGFSLIELLVVLALLSLAFSAVLLTPPDAGAALDREADRLLAHARHARDEAVMANRATALRIDRTGYGFEQRREGRWSPMGEAPYARRAFPEGVAAAWDGDADSLRLTYDALGGSDPVALWLTQGGERRRILFDAGGQGAVHAGR